MQVLQHRLLLAMSAFAVLFTIILLLATGVIDIDEGLRVESLRIELDCGVLHDDIVYWKLHSSSEIDAYNKDSSLAGTPVVLGDSIDIATLAESTFNERRIGDQWIVFVMQCRDGSATSWARLVEIDEAMLTTGRMRLGCPCKDDVDSGRDEWRRIER